MTSSSTRRTWIWAGTLDSYQPTVRLATRSELAIMVNGLMNGKTDMNGKTERIPQSLRCLGFTLAACLAASLQMQPVLAQYSGHNFLGDYGLRAGTQDPKGRYAGAIFQFYQTDTIRGGRGQTLDIQGSLDVFALAPFVNWTSDIKILGGTYGGLVAVSFVNLGLKLPLVDLDEGTFGLGDVYIQPFNLGWHAERARLSAITMFRSARRARRNPSHEMRAPIGPRRETAGSSSNLSCLNSDTSIIFATTR